MENNDSEQNFDAAFGTSKPFEYWLLKPDNPIVYCLLKLDGKDFLVKSGYTVELTQKTTDHDTFCITVRDDALDSFEGYVMEHSKNLLGKDITIIYHHRGKPRQTFSGIIRRIINKKDNGSGYGNLCITGYSPSILLENGKDCQSFENKTLEQIVLEVCSDHQQEAKVQINSNHLNQANTKILPYTVQYKESDYQFIKRLAIRHGEFFYYNGEKLIFGNTVQPIIKLGQGIDLKNIDFEMKMGVQDFKYISYDVHTGSKIEKDSGNIQSEFKEGIFTSIAVNTSRNIFRKKPKMHFNHTGIQSWSEGQLEEAVRLEKERRENLVLVRGKSDNPELRIGGRAELSDINAKAMETYRIIEIKHYHSGNKYYNEFVGILDLFNAAPYIDTEAVPQGEEQSARVKDNNDPMGMGRVRVQFPWQEEKNQITPWIRTTTIYAGAGRGDYKIPEIGDEVLVNFESGNAEKPYVSGALYNGKETSGYHTAGNDIKAERSRSGVEELINDAEGSWKQSTPDGNYYLMDGQKNTVINVPKDFTINVGGNFNINVGQNVSFLVGLRAIYNIGVQMMMNTPILKHLISDNYHLQSPKTLINGEGEIKIEAKETQVAGTEKLLMHSDESTVVNSKGIVNVKGKDGTNHSNIAETFTTTEILLDATCIVQFRPRSNWKGEFGFDWFRIGDTGLDGDTDYATLIGQYYTKVLTDPTTARNNDVNSWTTFFQTDPQPSAFSSSDRLDRLKNLYGNYSYSLDGNPVRKRYYRPFITLFPRTPDPANPKKFLEKGEAELQLYLEFQKVDGKEVKPDRVIFEVDGHLADNSHALVSISKSTIDKKDLSKKIEIVVTCNASFDVDKDINVFTVMLDESGKEKSRQSAGVLRIIAPAKQLQKNIVIVRVRTSAGNGKYAGIKEFKRNLRQALIIPNIVEKTRNTRGSLEDITLDVRKSVDNYNSIDFNTEFGVTGKNLVNEDGNTISLQNYLKAELEIKYPSQFTNHFKLFFLDNLNDYYEEKDAEGNVIKSGSTLGYSNRNTDFGIMFGNHDDSTIGHECLHGLGLPHTFFGNDYIYKALNTDNVMDYSHLSKDKVTGAPSTVLDRVSTWYWQWKKVNSNIN